MRDAPIDAETAQRQRHSTITPSTPFLRYQTCFNSSENGRPLPIHLNVSKSDYAESPGFEVPGAGFVIGPLLDMDFPIQFDYQPWFKADKVRYIRAYWMLPPKLESAKLTIPQIYP